MVFSFIFNQIEPKRISYEEFSRIRFARNDRLIMQFVYKNHP